MASFPGQLGNPAPEIKPFWILMKQKMLGRQWHQPFVNHSHFTPDR